jgi:hypothetical protein
MTTWRYGKLGGGRLVRTASLLALACALASGALAPSTATASATPVEIPSSVEPGVALPTEPLPSSPLGITSASAGLVLTPPPVYDEYAGQYLELRRVADGSVVRRVPYPSTGQVLPQLDGDVVVAYDDVSVPGSRRVTAEDAESGRPRWAVTLDPADWLLGSGATWVLVFRPEASGGTYAMDLLRPDGSRTAVRTSLPDRTTRIAGSDAWSVVLLSGTAIMRVELSSATLTTLSTTDAVDVGPLVAAGKVIWGAHDWGTGDDAITWWQPDGTVGSTTVHGGGLVDRYVPFGDRLAAVMRSCPDCLSLRPVDLTTGELQPAIADHVSFVQVAGGGSLAMVVSVDGDRRLASLADDGQPATLSTSLANPGRRARKVALSGSQVVAEFDSSGGDGTAVTALDGATPWSHRLGEDEALKGALSAAAGDVVATETAPATWQPPTYRLSWPTGHRDLQAWALSLGRGGQLVRVYDSGRSSLQDVRTGQEVAALDAGPGFIEGPRFWRASTDGSRIDVLDTTDGTSATVPTGMSCRVAEAPQVFGRYALLVCDDVDHVVDLTGAQRPYAVGPRVSSVLGGGFLLREVAHHDAQNQYYATLDAVELSGEHRVRSYGPIHSAYRPPDPSYAADDAGGPAAVYLDGTRGVRRIDLSWVTQAADVPPGPPSEPRSATAMAGDRSATVSWEAPALHPQPVTGYVVTVSPGGRTATASADATSLTVTGLTNNSPYTFTVAATSAAGAGQISAATAAVTPTDPTAPTVFLTSAPDGDWASSSAMFRFAATDATDATDTLRFECRVDSGAYQPCTSPLTVDGMSEAMHTFAVQAVDVSGNRSVPYTASWQVDTTRPVVVMTAPASVASAGTRFTARFRVSDRGWAGTRARYIAAPYTSGWRSPVYPSSWRSVPYDYVTVGGAAGWTYCVSAQAWDLAGNTSSWAPYRCTATPVDDRSLTRSSGWTRSSSSAFYGGSAVWSSKKGATLTRTGIQTRRLYLLATRCPTCGTVGVYWNGRLVKQVSLRSSVKLRRQIVPVTSFAGVRSGTLTLRVMSSGAPVQIDGVVLPRA